VSRRAVLHRVYPILMLLRPAGLVLSSSYYEKLDYIIGMSNGRRGEVSRDVNRSQGPVSERPV
jgi:hypothetical protein